jgi:tetratricopeptide (TPR) repeat protein/DNA-binding NarL/FixJ family response regulator
MEKDLEIELLKTLVLNKRKQGGNIEFTRQTDFCIMRGSMLFIFFLFVALTEAFGQNSDQSEAELLKSASQLASKNPEEAFRLVSDLIQDSKQQRNLDFGRAQALLGELLMGLSLYQEALGPLYEAEALFLELDCISCLADTHNHLGQLYYKIKGPEAALARHEKALSLFSKVEDWHGIAVSKGFIGGMYEKIGDYSKALTYQNESLEIFKAKGDQSDRAFVMENIGSIFEDFERYDSAFFYFEQAYKYNLSAGDSSALLGNLNNLGDVYRKSGNLDSAIFYSMKSLELSERLGNKYQKRSALVDLAKANELKGNHQAGFYFLEKARQLSELIFSEEAARQLAVKEAQYEVNEKIVQIAQLEQLGRADARIRWLLIFLILVLAVLGWAMINQQKLKIRGNKELLDRQNELLLIKERLIATEKENINLLEARMATEVEAQSKALTAQTLHVLDKNQMLEEIQQKLKKILEEDSKEQKKKIRNLIKQIDYNFSQDTDWDDFKFSFEKVHQDFFKKLNQPGKELTPGELKLASLMRMNLSSREIASTLGISQESLRISRYRLRKKLNLEKGESLQQFLLCI